MLRRVSSAVLACTCLFLACAEPTPNRAPDTAGSGSGGSPSSIATGGSPAAASGGQAPAGGADGSGGGVSDVTGGAGGTGGSGGEQATAGAAGSGSPLPARALIYHYSVGVIDSVPSQINILSGVLDGLGYSVEVSEDPGAFTQANLARFSAVLMINNCGMPFGQGRTGQAESEALRGFLQAGGGMFATHCASVTYTDADPPALYNQLLGGRAGGGFFNGQSNCTTVGSHPTVGTLPAQFVYEGDTDNTDYLAPDTSVVVRCKWTGNGEVEVAASWQRQEGQGRVFFTTFAKTDADLQNATLMEQHLVPALRWVLKLP
jgi:type 1 glutamine amidotransferase